ncbi:DNA topoisomerase III [Paragonimus skrjabini miyazakii]|uniref:DNA topoisomerase III n=1 Tax=Paragonimus skrjabini miyazakii TaxID=59628 RepID=A0A8S9YAI2_9TREM|nr:DNA topoisomerase III [Paragonimus skrjabini miyazakii]
MATKIFPDSFRTLSLDLSESVDFDFFDKDFGENNEKMSTNINNSEDSTQHTSTQSMQTTSAQKATDDGPDDPLDVENVQSSAGEISPGTDDKLAPAAEPAPTSSVSDFATHSVSPSYESDFSDLDTPRQNEDEHLNDNVYSSTESLNTNTNESEYEEENSHRLSERTDLTPTSTRDSKKGKPTNKNGQKSRELSDEDLERAKAVRLEKAMYNLNIHLRNMRIRPPWRDPNSRPLPSDRAASFYDLYEEFTRAHRDLPFSTNQRCSSQHEVAVCRPYHATLNRYREQERIQLENYNLAKRLENIRPTPGMTRKEQLREYKKYFMPSTDLPSRCGSALRRPETAGAYYPVDHLGDHYSKCSNHSKLEHSSRQVRSARPHPQRTCHSASSRSLITTMESTSTSLSHSVKNSRVQSGGIRGTGRPTGDLPGPSSSANLRTAHRKTKGTESYNDQHHAQPPTVTRKTNCTVDKMSLPTTRPRQETCDFPTPPPPSPCGSKFKHNIPSQP